MSAVERPTDGPGPHPTVQLTGPLDGHDHEHPDLCPCAPIQLDGHHYPVHRDSRIPGGLACIYTEESLMTPPVPDGPDTELAAAVRVLREWMPSEAEYPTGLLIEIARDLVRAVLARPAAGRDLTAQDVRSVLEAVGGSGPRQVIADRLNAVARPAVARTDEQPPADDEFYEPLRAEVRAGEADHDRRIGRSAAPADEPYDGLDPLAHVRPGHAADDTLCRDQHGPWTCTRDLQHPGQHISSIGCGQRVGAVWPAAPADDTAPTTPFTVDQEVRSTSGVRGTVRVANYTYSLVTWSNGTAVWVRNDELAPADDTAAPQRYELGSIVPTRIAATLPESWTLVRCDGDGGLVGYPRPNRPSEVDTTYNVFWLVVHAPVSAAAPADDTAAPGAYIATLIRADEQDQHDAVDPEAGGPTPEYLRGYRAGVERSAEVAAEALPVPVDAPDVWDHCVAPGGYVCGTCGTPTESEPCAEHQPAAAAGIEAAPRLCPRHGVAEPHQTDDGWDCAGQPVRDSQDGGV